MFKEIKYLKINFLKNTTGEGGAMNEIIKNLKENEKVIHIQNKKYGRMWGAVNESDIIRLTKKNIGLYEVLNSYPKKVYFDYDGKPSENHNLENIKNIILEKFPKAKFSISGYTNKEKISYHIILNNYIIQNAEQLEQLKAFVKYFSTQDAGFDWKVYTKNRFMRAINQSKIGKEPSKIIEDDNIKNHFISCFIPETYQTIPEDTSPEIEEIKFREQQPFEWSKIKKMELKTPEDLDLSDPLSLLKITPLDETFDHFFTHKIARFAFHNGLSIEDFISWYMKKSTDSKNIYKWKNYHWNRLESFPPITIKQYIKYILEHFYPNISTGAENINFINLWNNEHKKIKYTDYLKVDEMETEKKALILNLGMGSGKTTNTINYLKNVSSFCWITPNISLADNTFTRIKEAGIKNCFLYNTAKNAKQKKELIKNSNSVMICLNSLFYIQKNYEVIVIDEIETFLKLWYDNQTIKNLNECWLNFIKLLKQSKKILLLDAFISKITTDFLNSLNIEYEIIRKNKESNDREALILPSMKYFFNNIIKDLRNDKKLLIFYPFKNQRKNLPSMKQLKETIENLTEKKGIYHNAESNDKDNNKLKDVNKHWKDYDFVISNNKINVGLNFDVSHFNKCYLSIAGFNSPRDIIQFSYRSRELKDKKIIFSYIDKFNNFDSWEIETVNNNNEIFQKLGNNVFIEKCAPLCDTFEFFLNKAQYKIDNKTLFNKLNDSIKFPDNDYYDFENIDDYDKIVVEELERGLYTNNLNTLDKLAIKKYYFRKMFKKGTTDEELAHLWNNNKFNFINKVKNILINTNHLLHKLQKNYKWSLFIPDDIDKKFKFTKEDLQLIFDKHKFKDLNKKSKHHLIMRTYINSVLGCQLIKSKKDDNKHIKFYVCEKEKEIVFLVNKILKIPIQMNDVNFTD